MAISRSMGFPIQEKEKISIVEQETPQLQFLPVPGPQGSPGPQGAMGPQGTTGPKGDKGDKGDSGADGKDGKNGKNGINGKNGESYVPVYKQQAGWASYEDKSSRIFSVEPTRGENGWHDIYIDKKDILKNHSFLPLNCNTLYNEQARSFTFRSLEIGSTIRITYNFSLETFVNNTELWFATVYPEIDKSVLTMVGSFKYQGIFDLTVDQTIHIENKEMWFNFCRPYAKSDFLTNLILKKIYVSVS
jgi:hypothetical protein